MTPYQIGYLVGMLVTPLILMLVIGTIYYWIKGGRIPYRQAILSRWVIVASLILFLLGLVGRVSSYLQQESSHVYPERDIKAFTQGCVGSATKKLDIKAAESFCACSITEIQKAYTYGEFRKFDAEMNQQKSIPSGIQNIVTSCVQKH